MKFIQQPVAKPSSDLSRDRLLRDVQTQVHRLLVGVDELKGEGDVTALDAAERILWATGILIDGLTRAYPKKGVE